MLPECSRNAPGMLPPCRELSGPVVWPTACHPLQAAEQTAEAAKEEAAERERQAAAERWQAALAGNSRLLARKPSAELLGLEAATDESLSLGESMDDDGGMW